MYKVSILAYEGCMSGAVSSPADLFATANHIRAAELRNLGRKPLFSVQTVSAYGLPVISGSGQKIMPDTAIGVSADADVVIVPGLLVSSESELIARLDQLDWLNGFLTEMHAQGSYIAAGCTGSFILAEAGLLDHKRATTTWWLNDAFCRRYPQVTLSTRQMLVESGQLITAAAGTSYLDVSLFLIGKLAGPQIARECAAYLCVDGPRESQAAYAIPHHRQTRDMFVEKADLWIRQHIGEPIKMPILAEHMGVSVRTLARKFRSATGHSPSSYVQMVRMDHAKYLLHNTRLGTAQVAGEVGYMDEDAFRRAFRVHASDTPASFRRRAKNI